MGIFSRTENTLILNTETINGTAKSVGFIETDTRLLDPVSDKITNHKEAAQFLRMACLGGPTWEEIEELVQLGSKTKWIQNQINSRFDPRNIFGEWEPKTANNALLGWTGDLTPKPGWFGKVAVEFRGPREYGSRIPDSSSGWISTTPNNFSPGVKKFTISANVGNTTTTNITVGPVPLEHFIDSRLYDHVAGYTALRRRFRITRTDFSASQRLEGDLLSYNPVNGELLVNAISSIGTTDLTTDFNDWKVYLFGYGSGSPSLVGGNNYPRFDGSSVTHPAADYGSHMYPFIKNRTFPGKALKRRNFGLNLIDNGKPAVNTVAGSTSTVAATLGIGLGGFGSLVYDAGNNSTFLTSNSLASPGNTAYGYYSLNPGFRETLDTSSLYTMSFEWKDGSNPTIWQNSGNPSGQIGYIYTLVNNTDKNTATGKVNVLQNSKLLDNGWYKFEYTFKPLNSGVPDAFSDARNRIEFGRAAPTTSNPVRFYMRKVQFEKNHRATQFFAKEDNLEYKDPGASLLTKVSWVLHKFIPVSIQGGGISGFEATGATSSWQTTLSRYAFRSYADLIEAVTYTAGMARMLTYIKNQKASGELIPDENYAREIMQLFTIGLTKLNLDGTPILDRNGIPIPNYSNDDIKEMAKVFTGLTYDIFRSDSDYSNPALNSSFVSGGSSADYNFQMPEAVGFFDNVTLYRGTANTAQYPPGISPPMRHYLPWYETGPKVALGGIINIPENMDPKKSVRLAIEQLVSHPSCAPFVCKSLILFTVTSNPSPQYVERVAKVFLNNGRGRVGDMAAVWTAILTDPEAAYDFTNNPRKGRVRDGFEMYANLIRSFDFSGKRIAKIVKPIQLISQAFANTNFNIEYLNSNIANVQYSNSPIIMDGTSYVYQGSNLESSTYIAHTERVLSNLNTFEASTDDGLWFRTLVADNPPSRVVLVARERGTLNPALPLKLTTPTGATGNNYATLEFPVGSYDATIKDPQVPAPFSIRYNSQYPAWHPVNAGGCSYIFQAVADAEERLENSFFGPIDSSGRLSTYGTWPFQNPSIFGFYPQSFSITPAISWNVNVPEISAMNPVVKNNTHNSFRDAIVIIEPYNLSYPTRWGEWTGSGVITDFYRYSLGDTLYGSDDDLIERLNLLLCGGTLSDEKKALIKKMLANTDTGGPGGTGQARFPRTLISDSSSSHTLSYGEKVFNLGSVPLRLSASSYGGREVYIPGGKRNGYVNNRANIIYDSNNYMRGFITVILSILLDGSLTS